MKVLPKVKFANTEEYVTRLISGGNPLCGNSHFSHKMNEEMRKYFTEEQVVSYLHQLEESGINTLQARGDYHRIIYWLDLFRREGGKLHWIAQTASEMSDIFQNIRIIAAAGAIGIYHHGTQTDKFWQEGCIDKVCDYLKCIRDCGLQVGLGTHIPEVIEYAEEKGWDIDFYMACVYNISREPRESALVSGTQVDISTERFLEGDPPRMYKVIRTTDKMCLAFKILAANRLCKTQKEVSGAFHTAFENIKPKDAVVVGMYPRHSDQITSNVEYAIQACVPVKNNRSRK
ncbi:MAG: hypothetical protein GXO81_07945 [Chlorobi bacterium]|nr:hypothetical protein [Chlorobiota bacterium]